MAPLEWPADSSGSSRVKLHKLPCKREHKMTVCLLAVFCNPVSVSQAHSVRLISKVPRLPLTQQQYNLLAVLLLQVPLGCCHLLHLLHHEKQKTQSVECAHGFLQTQPQGC